VIDRNEKQTSSQRHAAWSRWFWDGLALACLLAGGWSFDRRLALGADFSVNQFLCAALLLRVLFGAWQVRREPVRGRATLGAVVACTAVLLARLPGSANPEYGVFKVVAYLGLILPVLVYVEATLREPRDLQRWFVLMALAAVGLLLLSLRHAFDLEQGERLAILGGGPNVFARLVGMGVIATLVQATLWHQSGGRRAATIAWVAIPLAVLAMVFAGSKAALLALVLASLVVLHAVGARRLARVLIIGMIAGVGIPIVAHPFVQHLNKDGGIVRLLRLPDFEDSFGSYGSRVRFTLGSLEQIRARPWWGVGTGAWGNALGVGMEGAYPHNLAIEIASETGLVGLAIVLVPFAWFPRRRAIADPVVRLRAAGVAAIALFWAINVSLSGDLVDSRYFWLALLLLELHAGSLPRRTGRPVVGSGGRG